MGCGPWVVAHGLWPMGHALATPGLEQPIGILYSESVPGISLELTGGSCNP